MKKARLNWTIWLGTDCHQFLIFHPKDVAHLRSGWSRKKSTVQKELAAGRLVSFTTSGQGQYQIRITDGSLTARESRWRVTGPRWCVPTCDFRLVVCNGRLFVDNGDCIPGETSEGSEERKDQWFDVPNGNYRVPVNGLKWYEEPGGLDANEKRTPNALPDYVICFESVPDLELIEPPKKFPAIW